MLRPSHLPPRYPFQKKVPAYPNYEPYSFSPPKDHEPGTRHQKSYARSSSLEDQPDWLDDLLSDSDSSSSPKGTHHCQSAGDASTSFHSLVPNTVLWPSDDDKRLCSVASCNQLESECIYGPHSPRRKCNVEFSQSSALLALSKYVSSSPMQFIDEVSHHSRASDSDLQGDCHYLPNELNSESKLGKRHPGQRSKARKLQYIAELEKTVNSFQAVESELTIKCSTLLQQRVALSMENSKLKQQMARLQQQKLMKDGEYQTLRKEAERLSLGLASSLSRQLPRHGSSCDINDSEICLRTLNWKRNPKNRSELLKLED